MTREEAIQFLDNMRGNENGRAIGAEGFYAELCGYHVQALNMAIKALEHPEQNVIAVVPCGDCISRQAAIDTIESWLSCDDYNEAERHIMRATESILYDLPSVNPQEPKMGQFAKWVAEEIFDENWEYNKDAFAEIACRKLEKLGIVRAKGDEWELIKTRESEDKEE